MYLGGAAGCVLSSRVACGVACGGLGCTVVLYHFLKPHLFCRLTECVIIFYVGQEKHKEVAMLGGFLGVEHLNPNDNVPSVVLSLILLTVEHTVYKVTL